MCSTNPSTSLSDGHYAVVSLSLFYDSAEESASVSIAHVPFDFMVGDMQFLPGAYAVEPSLVPGRCSVRPVGCESPRVLVQAISIPRQRNGMSRKLLFYQQRNRYFLAQVVAAADQPVTPSLPRPA
jgi:hypothetical protein